jgi:hypothetical protein
MSVFSAYADITELLCRRGIFLFVMAALVAADALHARASAARAVC